MGDVVFVKQANIVKYCTDALEEITRGVETVTQRSPINFRVGRSPQPEYAQINMLPLLCFPACFSISSLRWVWLE